MDYRDYITIEPNKRGGKRCVRGLRITVYEVLEYLASEMTEEKILEDFPDLTHEDLKACIAYAADRQVRRLSKGMLQRTGLAAALVSDPEMLILDEPMSGLDPVGRKEVKDLIFAERDRGRTIFFSTHLLGDVESMCDRVAILREGKVVVSGALRSLLRGDVLRTEITLANVSTELEGTIVAMGFTLRRRPDLVIFDVEGEGHVGEVLRAALDGGAQIVEVTPRRETLEDLFLRRAL